MRENVNPWDYRYARSIPTKLKVFEFGYVYNICNLLVVLKPLIYSSYRELMRICIVILNQSNQHHQGCKVHLQCAVIFHLMLQGNT